MLIFSLVELVGCNADSRCKLCNENMRNRLARVYESIGRFNLAALKDDSTLSARDFASEVESLSSFRYI